MRPIPTLVRLSAPLIAFIAVGSAAAPTTPADRSVVIPIEDLHFYLDKEGFTVANGWRDPTTGPHSNYIKIAGGSASGLHMHTYSYYGVVIAGVVANEPAANSVEHPLAPGSYWYQKGKEPHVTKCISQSECLIFVTSSGPFDYLPVK